MTDTVSRSTCVLLLLLLTFLRIESCIAIGTWQGYTYYIQAVQMKFSDEFSSSHLRRTYRQVVTDDVPHAGRIRGPLIRLFTTRPWEFNLQIIKGTGSSSSVNSKFASLLDLRVAAQKGKNGPKTPKSRRLQIGRFPFKQSNISPGNFQQELPFPTLPAFKRSFTFHLPLDDR